MNTSDLVWRAVGWHAVREHETAPVWVPGVPSVLSRGAPMLCLADLRIAHSSFDALAELLAEDERAQAARYRLSHDRAQFVLARGLLRLLLGHFLGCAPRSVVLATNAFGKPRVASTCRLSFNLSHSGDYALYAFADTQEVGVDIEAASGFVGAEVATVIGTARELAMLRALPPAERARLMLRLWVAKEAYVKAIGTGWYTLPTDIELELRASDALRVVQAPGDIPTWHLREFACEEGYRAAVIWTNSVP